MLRGDDEMIQGKKTEKKSDLSFLERQKQHGKQQVVEMMAKKRVEELEKYEQEKKAADQGAKEALVREAAPSGSLSAD